MTNSSGGYSVMTAYVRRWTLHGLARTAARVLFAREIAASVIPARCPADPGQRALDDRRFRAGTSALWPVAAVIVV
jgi:hypothetical protein